VLGKELAFSHLAIDQIHVRQDMKETIRRIWKDISHGRNIVNYVLICIAILLPALNLLGIASSEWIIRLCLPVLGILVANALSNGWLLREIQLGVKHSPVRIHKRWTDGEIYTALAEAKKSVTIIGTWAVDSPTLGDYIRQACEREKNKITIDVYMLDPDKPYGKQRYIEVYSESAKRLNFECEEAYRTKFKDAADNFRIRLGNLENAHLTIYKYPTMPSIKLFIVDNEKFFFSWLSALEATTPNVCFELTVKGSNEESYRAIEKIRNHLQKLSSDSVVYNP